jgi:hypothetical protein
VSRRRDYLVRVDRSAQNRRNNGQFEGVQQILRYREQATAEFAAADALQTELRKYWTSTMPYEDGAGDFGRFVAAIEAVRMQASKVTLSRVTDKQ